MLADVGEDGQTGLELLRLAKAVDPDLAIIMMAPAGSIVNAVECMKLGAYDYLLKSIKPDELCGREGMDDAILTGGALGSSAGSPDCLTGGGSFCFFSRVLRFQLVTNAYRASWVPLPLNLALNRAIH